MQLPDRSSATSIAATTTGSSKPSAHPPSGQRTRANSRRSDDKGADAAAAADQQQPPDDASSAWDALVASEDQTLTQLQSVAPPPTKPRRARRPRQSAPSSDEQLRSTGLSPIVKTSIWVVALICGCLLLIFMPDPGLGTGATLGLGGVIAMMGIAAAIVASIWLLVKAFAEDVVCGIFYLLVPFYWLYYIATRWDVCKKPILLASVGFVLLLRGSGLIPGLGQTRPLGPSTYRQDQLRGLGWSLADIEGRWGQELGWYWAIKGQLAGRPGEINYLAKNHHDANARLLVAGPRSDLRQVIVYVGLVSGESDLDTATKLTGAGTIIGSVSNWDATECTQWLVESLGNVSAGNGEFSRRKGRVNISGTVMTGPDGLIVKVRAKAE